MVFSWNPVQNAVSYEVSTDGGATWITPSSGATGLTHTVTGLQPLTEVTLTVRAKGTISCQVSVSAPIRRDQRPCPLRGWALFPFRKPRRRSLLADDSSIEQALVYLGASLPDRADAHPLRSAVHLRSDRSCKATVLPPQRKKGRNQPCSRTRPAASGRPRCPANGRSTHTTASLCVERPTYA